VTVGTFDGVHLGHRAILQRLRTIADELGGQVVVLTFHPHPRKVLGTSGVPLVLINTLEERIQLFESLGVDTLVVQEFTSEFSRMGFEEFVRQVLVKALGVKKLVIGYDHQFGHKREGGMPALLTLAPALGFEVEEIPEQDIDAIAVSSTRIRNALQTGDVQQARQLLGYAYPLSGEVVGGRQLGRTIGYPTANISVSDTDKLIPANGVYAVWVLHEGKRYQGALSIGNRPTFDNGERSIEVHILGFNREIYGQKITLEFMYRLRPELKFESVSDLVLQMEQDCIRVSEVLNV
jgi:riboflavin kinase/FMN adenylyltransferase